MDSEMDPKDAAREYLLAAEKYIKDSLFDEARREVKKAQEIDPSNVYTFAFLERIEFFQQQKDKNNGAPRTQGVPTDVSPESAETITDVGQIESGRHEITDREITDLSGGGSVSIGVNEFSPPRETEITELKERLESISRSLKEQDISTTRTDELISRLQVLEEKIGKFSAHEAGTGDSTGPEYLPKIAEIENRLEDLKTAFETAIVHGKDAEYQRLADEFALKVQSLEKRIKESGADTSEPSAVEAPRELIIRIAHLEKRVNDYSVAMQSEIVKGEMLDAISSKFEEIERQVSELIATRPAETVQDSVGSTIENKVSLLAEQIGELSRRIEQQDTGGAPAPVNTELENKYNELVSQIHQIRTTGEKHESIISAIALFEEKLLSLQETVTKVHERTHRVEGFTAGLDDLHRQILEGTKLLRDEIDAYRKEQQTLTVDIRSVGEISGEYNKTSSELENLRRQIEEIRTATAERQSAGIPREEFDGRFTDIEKRFTEIDRENRSHEEYLGEFHVVNNKIESLANSIVHLSEELAKEKEARTGSESPVERFAAIESHIAELNRILDLHTGTLNRQETLEREYQGVLTRISELQDAIETERTGFVGSAEIDRMFASVHERITNLQSSLQDRKNADETYNELKNRQSELSDRTSDLKNEIERQRGSFVQPEVLEQKLEALETRIKEELQSKFSEADKTGEFENKLASLEMRIKEELRNELRVTDISEEFGSRLASLEERIREEFRNELRASGLSEELENRFAFFEQRVKNEIMNEVRASSMNGDIGSKLASMEQRINELHSVLVFESESQERITELEAAHSGISDSLEELRGKIDGVSPDLSAFGEHLAKLEEQINVAIDKSRGMNNYRTDIESLKDSVTDIFGNLDSLKKFTDNEHSSRVDKESLAFARLDEFAKKITSITGILEKLELVTSERSRLSDRQYEELVNQIGELHSSVDRERKSREAFVQLEQRFEEAHLRFNEDRRGFATKLYEMTSVITGLKASIDLERKERELLQERQLEVGKRHFLGVLEKAWTNGKPSEEDALEIQRLAELFSVPEEMLQQLERDIKRKMYTRAAKAALSDQKILKDRSFSLEGLRNRYGVTMEEYIEFESSFLHELVSQQFNGTILLVSGNEALREELTQRLKESGFAVAVSTSPDSALQKIEIVNPHLIISEMDFPDMKVNGLNLLNVLRKNKRFAHVPFIIITGMEELPRIQAVLFRPNESVITKPVAFDTLISAVNTQLLRLRELITSQSL
jgi:DNA repair exonuclease SbcCD ATPase subunit/CheY-like chemotaxis protein